MMAMRRARTTLGLAVAAGCLLTGMAPAAADAATLAFVADRATYTAGGGEQNHLRIGVEEDGLGNLALLVRDDGFVNVTTIGGNCERDSTGGIWCDYVPNTTINLGDGNDSFRGTHSSSGGISADLAPTHDTVNGGSGNDQLAGWLGNDTLDGGEGDDVLETPRYELNNLHKPFGGGDVIRGGPGTDELSYYGKGDPVAVTLDGAANDGAGEGDNVASDVELVQGTWKKNDSLTGDDGPNELDGVDGDDTLRGLGGDDRLVGELGSDFIDGGSGSDTLSGGGGFDEIEASDGVADSVSCGAEHDVARVDTQDAVSSDCERVERTTVVDPSLIADGAAPEISGTILSRLRLRSVLRSGLRIGVHTNETSTFVGAAYVSGRDARGLKVVSAKTVRVASGGAVLSEPGEGTLVLRFTKKAKKRLARRKRVRLRVTATAHDAAGNESSLVARITLKR